MTARDPYPPLRLPPHSLEAEQSLIGGLLLENTAWDRVADLASEVDFYRDDHRRIYRHIARLIEMGKPADVVTVFESLEKSGEAEQAGGLAYLGEIANNTPSAANIRRYAEIVRERAVLRRLIGVAEGLADACFSGGAGKTAGEIAAATEAQMLSIIDSHVGEPTALAVAFGQAMAYIDHRGDAGGLSTGFRDFDAITGGLEPGQLIVVAARPAVGKSIFGCNVSDHVAQDGGSVLFSTLEMTAREIGMRILSARSQVSVQSMRVGAKHDYEWSAMSNQLLVADRQRLAIDDTPAISMATLRAKARRLKRKAGGLDLIVIDYIGLMTGQGDNRTQQLGSISRGLKSLAKELHVPIIALSQLNRGVEGRTDKRPMMSDLRDSGEIEQDADIVAMLHRESLYSDSPEWGGLAELLIRKNRNGPTGDILLGYDPQHMRFTDHSGPHPRRQMTAKQGDDGHRFARRKGGFDD